MSDKPDDKSRPNPPIQAGLQSKLMMAKAPDPQERLSVEKYDGEDVVYLPGPADPPSVPWRGHIFRANVPKRITDPEHIEAARGNRFFRVGASDPNEPNPNDAPSTAMQYRAHVVAWIKTCESIDDVVRHWSEDRQLRQACDVGEDDIKWLGTITGPKVMEFKRREGMNEQNFAGVWIKYGFTEIPWRG